jgi:oxygen-independent coproporphyrinogen-3 oxidase
MQFSEPINPLQQARTSRDLLQTLDTSAVTGLYLHVPFCFHKCHYCDFYSIVDDRDRQAVFARRMSEEIRDLGRLVGPSKIGTIFVGGGTPTLLRTDLWEQLLDSLHESFELHSLVEFTVEANPETVTDELLGALVAGGVNRMSIGAQSFNEAHLKTLERWHDPRKVETAVAMARRAGIDNINLDLIFAVPGQTVDEWANDLRTALALEPTHLSCYSLTYEPNTAMTRKLAMGLIAPADEAVEAAMFEHTIDTLTAAGFEHYEVSNFARKGTVPRQNPKSNRCQHNLMYWLNGQWLATGPSASGHVAGVRWKNLPHLGKYLAHEPTPIQDVERLDPEASIGEQLMLRFRLIEGVPWEWCEQALSRKRQETVARLIDAGSLERTPTHLRLTRAGLMVADSVIAALL